MITLTLTDDEAEAVAAALYMINGVPWRRRTEVRQVADRLNAIRAQQPEPLHSGGRATAADCQPVEHPHIAYWTAGDEPDGEGLLRHLFDHENGHRAEADQSLVSDFDADGDPEPLLAAHRRFHGAD